MPGTVVFLGAGATKACSGPLTGEILPAMLAAKESPLIGEFLETLFHVNAASPPHLFPSLPLVMSLLDMALDRRQAFHPQWDAARISELRQAVEIGIFDLLEEKLLKAPTNNHWILMQQMYPAPAEPCVIGTNYDLIADTAMMSVSQTRLPDGRLPSYCCQIRSAFYTAETGRFGTLLKLHGSLNWLHCRTCHRLEIGASESRKYINVLARMIGPSLEQSYTPDGNPCPGCGTRLRPLLIAPTHLKDYRNPHLSQVWYEAERVLRDCDRVIFIGYSLPDDDVEVIYLLKRGLTHLTPDRVTVVEYDPALPPLATNSVGRRYRTLFGDGIDWHPEGLDFWLPTAQAYAAGV